MRPSCRPRRPRQCHPTRSRRPGTNLHYFPLRPHHYQSTHWDQKGTHRPYRLHRQSRHLRPENRKPCHHRSHQGSDCHRMDYFGHTSLLQYLTTHRCRHPGPSCHLCHRYRYRSFHWGRWGTSLGYLATRRRRHQSPHCPLFHLHQNPTTPLHNTGTRLRNQTTRRCRHPDRSCLQCRPSRSQAILNRRKGTRPSCRPRRPYPCHSTRFRRPGTRPSCRPRRPRPCHSIRTGCR